MTQDIQVANIIDLAPIKVAEKIMDLEKAKKQIESALDLLKKKLLEETRKSDVLTLKTGAYTIMRKELHRFKVLNHMEARKFLESKGVPVETEEVMNMKYMAPVIKNYKEDIPGVEKTVTEYISVRMAKERNHEKAV